MHSYIHLRIHKPKAKTWCQKCLDLLLLDNLFLWINAGRGVRSVVHTSCCLSPWPGGIQAHYNWYPSEHNNTYHPVLPHHCTQIYTHC